MIIMALDHTREFFHAGAFQFSPEDLAKTTPLLFMTRWVTHICAPVFMFAAGMGAFFWLQRPGRTPAELSRFLWTRGLWLVVLELTVLRFAMNLNVFVGPLLLSILWALGWSMVALGFLVRIRRSVLLPLSLLVIGFHNVFDFVTPDLFGRAGWIWNLIHQPGLIQWGPLAVICAYPLVPWIFVMATGYCAGNLMTRPVEAQRKLMLSIGLALIAVFIAIRFVNVYGDPFPWSADVPGMAFFSFIRCVKYPPSLDFLLMTLGPALLLLAWFTSIRWPKNHPFIVFGRVPLFFFLVHMLVIRLLTLPFAWFRYGRFGFLLNPLPTVGGPTEHFPNPFGYPLWVVYLVWIGVVVGLYPLCLWFARVKDRRRDWWLSYL
jgi:uncharacterized membrane protein